ncbi:MAG: MBL fold metallo-hydrolase [Gammaproteobacteria bacterium]
MPLKLSTIIFSALMLFACSSPTRDQSLPNSGTAHYLGNEGLLITTPHGKVLFDPFFHNSYGHYTLVPEEIRLAIFSGEEPYDDISAIVVSHAHGDHFSAEDTLRYLKANGKASLIGPDQAIDQLRLLEGASAVESQLRSLSLEVGDPVVESRVNSILIESIRIPHAGYPDRQEVANLVHRVTFGDELNVIHMGDADPNDIHFAPYKAHWEKRESELAFPPYWFFTSRFGPGILTDRINAVESIGVHVPTKIPNDLTLTDEDFLSVPGEIREFSLR